MFLRGVPHLCERMRRLSSKDVAKRREETANEPPPDLYFFSQKYPLPEAQELSLPGSIINTPPAFTGGTSSSSQASIGSGIYDKCGTADTVSDIEALTEIEKRRQLLMASSGHQQVTTGPSSLSGSSAGGDDATFSNTPASISQKNVQDRMRIKAGAQEQNDIDVLAEFMKTVDPKSVSPDIYMQLLSIALADKKKKEQHELQVRLPSAQQQKNADLPQIVNLIFELSHALPQGLHSLLKLVELLVDQDKKTGSSSAALQDSKRNDGNLSSTTSRNKPMTLHMKPSEAGPKRSPEGTMQAPPPKRQQQQTPNTKPQQQPLAHAPQGFPPQMNEMAILQQILSSLGGNAAPNSLPSTGTIPQQTMMADQLQQQGPSMNMPQQATQAQFKCLLPSNQPLPQQQQQQQQQQLQNQPLSQQQLNDMLGAFMMQQQSGSPSMRFN